MSKILLPQLISMLAASSGKSKKQSEAFLKAFFATITDALADHESVKIKGIGTFKVNRIEARKSVNVSTGEDVQIPAHYRVVFTPAKSMAEKVNKEFAWLDVVEIADSVSNEELDAVKNKTIDVKEEIYDLPQEAFKEEIPEINSVLPAEENPVEVTQTPREEIPESEPEIVSVEVSEKEVELPVEDLPEEVGEVKEIIEEIPLPSASEPSEETNKNVYSIGENVMYMHQHPVAPTVSSPTTWTVAGSHEPTEQEEERSEKLGEELEQEFGNIEPVEPFGPVDPGDLEPGEPIPADRVAQVPEFDPYVDLKSEDTPSVEESSPEKYYITREEMENLLTKSDLKPIIRNIKKVKLSVDNCEERSVKRSRNSLIWSIVICAALMTGGFFLLYYILADKFVRVATPEVENIEAPEIQVVEEDNSEPETVAGIGANTETPDNSKSQTADTQKSVSPSKQSSAANTAIAPTTPSDIRAMDKITSTRYLTTMAKEYYGNYNFWPYIYIENEGKLGHPDRIKPGTAVVIPDIAKYDIDPNNPKDIEKARKLGVDIYKKYASN